MAEQGRQGNRGGSMSQGSKAYLGTSEISSPPASVLQRQACVIMESRLLDSHHYGHLSCARPVLCHLHCSCCPPFQAHGLWGRGSLG